MGRVRLPNQPEVETIKRFLGETSMLHIDGVEFGKPATGLSLKVTFRDFQGHAHTKTMMCPDMTDFQDAVVLMSEWLEQLSGVAQARELQRQKRIAADG